MNIPIKDIMNLLSEHHKDAVCELDFNTPYELLVAVILSAQCTDKRVNLITAELFKRYNTPSQFASMTIEELSPLIFSCGFYRSKAKNIISASRDIVDKYNGEVPSTMEELVKLDGVGNKTASVIYSVAFKGDAIAVDTHVYRVSKRLGLASANTPDKVMNELMESIDRPLWSRLHHLLVHHGRYICKSQRPLCEQCRLNNICKYKKEQEVRE